MESDMPTLYAKACEADSSFRDACGGLWHDGFDWRIPGDANATPRLAATIIVGASFETRPRIVSCPGETFILWDDQKGARVSVGSTLAIACLRLVAKNN